MNPYSDAPSIIWELVDHVRQHPTLTSYFSTWCAYALLRGEPHGAGMSLFRGFSRAKGLPLG